MKSMEEKNKSKLFKKRLISLRNFKQTFLIAVKLRLMDKFKAVPEKVILLAMDSVDYDEERAAHILDIMVAEEAIKPLHTSSSQR